MSSIRSRRMSRVNRSCLLRLDSRATLLMMMFGVRFRPQSNTLERQQLFVPGGPTRRLPLSACEPRVRTPNWVRILGLDRSSQLAIAFLPPSPLALVGPRSQVKFEFRSQQLEPPVWERARSREITNFHSH